LTVNCFQAFLDALSRKFARQDILLVLDGAPNHRSGQLVVPENITLLFLPPYSPELNPKENLWDEIREKIFKNYALKSIDHVRQKLNEAILYVERNPAAHQAYCSVANGPNGSSSSTKSPPANVLLRGRREHECHHDAAAGLGRPCLFSRARWNARNDTLRIKKNSANADS
jgi:hypothetical protein